MTTSFTLLTPGLGALDLASLAPHLLPEGETPLTKPAADAKIAKAVEKLERLRKDLARAPEASYPPDTERWNPYPRLDADDEDEEFESPADRIEGEIAEAEDAVVEALRRSGRLPVRFDGESPSPAQSRAVEWFAENVSLLFGPLTFPTYDENEEDEEPIPARSLTELAPDGFRLVEAQISRWDDPAFVHVSVEGVDEEHGFYVVLREGEPPACGTHDTAFEHVASDPEETRRWEARESDPGYRAHEDLVAAAMEKDHATMRRLIADGAKINALDDDGYSPLWHAINEYDPEGVRILLEAGADPSLREDGKTGLGTARELFTQLSWTERPQGLIGRAAAFLARNVAPKDEDGDTVGTKELAALKEIIHLLETKAGLRPTKFR